MYFLFKLNKIIITSLTICIFANLTAFAATLSPEEDVINENMIKYEELDDKAQSLNSKIAQLDIEIETLNTQLNENNAKIDDTKREIDTTKQLLVQNENELKDSQLKLDTRIRSIYKSNLNSNILVLLISSKSFSDLFYRMDAINKVVSLDKSMMQEINDKKDSLNQNIDKLSDDEKKLKSLNDSIASNLNDVNSKKNEQQGYLDELNSQKDKIFAVIEANEKKLIEHPLSIIASSSSSDDISIAVSTLNSLLPQLNSSNVKSLAENGIADGNSKIASLNTPPSGNITENEDGKATYTMESTAYTGGGFTAMGLKPVRNPDGISTVAVDPNVIPLGSKVHVSGYGVAIASDTGGAIKGNKIDVYLDSYSECMSWGRRNVTVTVLAYPGEW